MDPAKMKVVDLRSELGALGLDTKGNKPALVERLKKALEAKSGIAIADTTILDTSTEDADEPATPRRAGPAARTRRRSSSTRAVSTPAKVAKIEASEPIAEESKPSEPEPEPVKEPSPEPVQQPQPVPAPEPEPEESPEPVAKQQAQPDSEMYSIDDEKSQSPVPAVKTDEEPMEVQEAGNDNAAEQQTEEPKTEEGDKEGERGDGEEKGDEEDERRQQELTEEEEWEQLNERLQQKEKERIEREKKQAEEDAKRLEELSKDPVKLHRLKRKQEKKARWSNFYKAVAVTNEVLTPPVEDSHDRRSKKQEATDAKNIEPDINDNKLTLSWYDSDLNQYLELPELQSVVPLSDGAFAHAWAGTRATHGAASGRVCYEVRVGAVVTTTETTVEKEVISSGLRVGWSTVDSSLHLGEGELSFGYENTGRAVNNGEFKEYGKTFTEKDVIGVYLDLDSTPCKVSYTLNGAELGVAHEFERAALGERGLFPHVLTKNMCYRVNFGDDQYNMLTKTKIVRKRLEIPVEQVLEEKRLREEEIQRQKDEAAKKERERREREKKEREERQRKKREEREKQDRERKEKEAQERKDKGEEVSDKPAEGEGDKEAEKEKTDEHMENGDKPEEVPEVKQEPMETESEAKEEDKQEEEKKKDEEKKDGEEKKDDTEAEVKEVKEEPAPEGEVPEVTEEQVLKGLTLDKRIKFVIRFTVEQELDGPEACLLPGFVLIAGADLVEGPRRPAELAQCEVIMMVGMPGAGKTHWVRQHVAAHPERRYNVLSTATLFDCMQVDCKPFRATCEGRWDAMLSKGAKCVLKLLEFAHGRRRNYILDQTNVYPSAQRRKLREFDGYRRIAVVVVPDTETYNERAAKRENSDGKEVPDGAIVDMKANFTLPEKCAWIDEVIYPELSEEEAKKVLEAFHKEAKAAGVVREREKRDRSATRDAPPHKRPRSGERRHARDDRRRDFSRDREDRWGGGGGGGSSRWGGSGGSGGSGGRGGRWGARDTRPPQGRFDRPWGGRDNGAPPFSRDRDGFRGGRGGPGGPGGPPGGPPRGERGPPRQEQRFGRGPERSARPQDKRPGPPPPQGGGAGSWQRGGQGGGRGAHAGRGAPGAMQRAGPQGKDVQQGQQQGQQQGWNQWANSGWGGWNNWNQNQAAWGNWGNWGNWNNAQQGQQGAAGAKGQGAGQQAQGQQGQQATQQQWQQWYQWQQWQQQQGWPGYQQGGNQQQAGQASSQDQQAQWAQYYQNYGAHAAANNAVADKK